MTLHLNPYLIFDGNAREAMTFYQSVLGGELEVMTFGDMGMEGEGADGTMHASLDSPIARLMASDGPPGEPLRRGNDVAIAISADAVEDEGTIRGYWEAFAGSGTVDVPLEKQVWGDLFGQVTDQFGVTWMFNGASEEAAATA